MEEGKVSESHLTSAAAFVEGGIQDACDDACSICLEPFCDSDPSTVTSCKHEFHLQCVLEWCQRSPHCPMCWQAISLKDPSSQELLEGVEHERNVRMNPPRTSTIFRHPTLGDFELQHLPVNASESELEERIIQHLAAAAAMGRARQLASREGRSRSSSQGRPHYLVLSTHGNEVSATSHASPLVQTDGSGPLPAVVITSPNSSQPIPLEDSSQLAGPPASSAADQLMATASGSSVGASPHGPSSNNRRSPSQTTPSSQDRAGPSDLQTFSESLKTRFSALSTRYKETITKSTKSWKERFFARNSSQDSSSEVRREANQSINNDQNMAAMSRMVDHLQIAEGSTTIASTPPNIAEEDSSSTSHPAERPQHPTGSVNEEIARASSAAIPASD